MKPKTKHHLIGEHGAVGWLTPNGRICAECRKPIKEPKLPKVKRKPINIKKFVKLANKIREGEEWEKKLKLYLTSAGDRRRTIVFILNLLSSQEKEIKEGLRKKIEGMRQINNSRKFDQEFYEINGFNQALDDVQKLLKGEK